MWDSGFAVFICRVKDAKVLAGCGVPCILSQPVLRVLLIEDNPGDAELVKEALKDVVGAAFQVDHVEALAPGLDRLVRANIDLVLLDVSLPDSHGLDGLSAVRILAPSIPVVLLTGWDSESLALHAVQAGAQDYLVKGTLQGPALARTLQQAIVRQRIHAETASLEPRQGPGKVVGFLGVKGGVGNSTIACHFGTELKRQTEGRVLMMDLDLASNAIGFLMNVNAPYSIIDASEDVLKLDEDRWGKLVGSGSGGVDIIQSGGPVFREEKQPKVERVRFVLRFVRTLYRWVVVDLGRLSSSSVLLAAEVCPLYLVATCDMLGLNEAKAAVGALVEAGFDRDSLALIVNQTPAHPYLSRQELEKLLGVRVEAMLPECNEDFANSLLDGKRLGESRKFQKHLTQLAAGNTGAGKEEPVKKDRFPLLMRAFRNATAGNQSQP
jgi:Flp pilus assembly CpaE family ATPase